MLFDSGWSSWFPLVLLLALFELLLKGLVVLLLVVLGSHERLVGWRLNA